jgi:hypothetical protein
MVGEVEDCQPPMPEGHRAITERPLMIRPAQLQPRRHPPYRPQIGTITIESQFTAYAAHGRLDYFWDRINGIYRMAGMENHPGVARGLTRPCFDAKRLG